MYMTIRQYPIQWGSLDEILRLAREGFYPAMRAYPGFISYQVMDPGDGTVVAVSLFATRDAASDANVRATEWVRENLGAHISGPPRIIWGPVRVDVPNGE